MWGPATNRSRGGRSPSRARISDWRWAAAVARLWAADGATIAVVAQLSAGGLRVTSRPARRPAREMTDAHPATVEPLAG